MVDAGVGVTTLETYELKRIDEDYFAEVEQLRRLQRVAIDPRILPVDEIPGIVLNPGAVISVPLI
jgi:hypothetical protein